MKCLCETPLESIHLQLDEEGSPVACSHCGTELDLEELSLPPSLNRTIYEWTAQFASGELTTKEANDTGHTLVYRLQAALDGQTLVFYIPLDENINI